MQCRLQKNPVTNSTSQVLVSAQVIITKSHLLAALLRAHSIPVDLVARVKCLGGSLYGRDCVEVRGVGAYFFLLKENEIWQVIFLVYK